MITAGVPADDIGPDPVINRRVPLNESHICPVTQVAVPSVPTTDATVPTAKVAAWIPAIPGVIGAPVNTGLLLGAAPVICSTL